MSSTSREEGTGSVFLSELLTHLRNLRKLWTVRGPSLYFLGNQRTEGEMR
jgi:hypothetical protein